MKENNNVNPIQFAVVREDFEIESTIIKQVQAQKILLIASGGCNALNLKLLYPNSSFTLIDINPAQIKLVQNKILRLSIQDTHWQRQFNIDVDDPKGLNACGNFESLFRCFRDFINEFIMDKLQIVKMFTENIYDQEQSNEKYNLESNKIVQELIQHKYWRTAFDLFFSNSLLITMFGEDAIQHAVANSYPTYFREIMEKGLKNTNRHHNYFLHHIFLGHYLNRKESLPPYLSSPELSSSVQNLDFTFINKNLLEIGFISEYDVISLSNIFDWMSEQTIKEYFHKLNQEMKAGSFFIFRQLNNKKDYSPYFSSNFIDHKILAEKLLANDRSLFYEKIVILQKKEDT